MYVNNHIGAQGLDFNVVLGQLFLEFRPFSAHFQISDCILEHYDCLMCRQLLLEIFLQF